MAVIKKRRNKGQPTFAGIVVSGASKNEAIDQYRAVASGENAQALRSADSQYQMVTVASNAESMFDPLTGNNDMVAVDAQINLSSESSGLSEPVHAFMAVCADGCGHIVIADSDQAVKFCPSCSTAIPDLSNEEIDRLSSESEAETTLEGPTGHQGVIVAAASFDEAETLFVEAMNNENVTGISDNTDINENVSESSSAGLAFNTHNKCDVNFSPFYGESSVEQNEDIVQNFEAVASEQDGESGHAGHYLLCSEDVDCGMHIIASNNEAVFCPSCSGALVDPADIEEMESLALADDDENENFASVSESGSDEDEDDDEDGDEVDVDVSDDDDEDDDMESDSANADEDEDDLESTSMDDMDGDDFEEEDAELDDLDDLEDDEDEDEDFESDSTTQEVKVNLLQLVASNEDELTPEHLSVAHCGAIAGVDTWTAFYKGTPIAMAKANAVPDTVSQIFNSAKYGEATTASARELGVDQALSSMGFQAIQPECSVEVAVAQSIMDEADSVKQQALASVDSQRNDMVESFGASLATAAMGINRGVFAGTSNPIRDNLIASLSAAGIKDPAPLVDRAFEQGSDSFAKILLAKAADINSKAPEVQNQIAESVAQTNFLAATASMQGVEDIGTVVASAEEQHQTQSPALSSESSSSNMKSMVQGLNLGRR